MEIRKNTKNDNFFFQKRFFHKKTKMWKIENCHFFLPAWNEKIGKIPLPPLAMMWCAKKSCSAKWQFSPSLNRGVGAIAEKFPIFLFQAWMVHRHEKIGNAILFIFIKTLNFQTNFSKKNWNLDLNNRLHTNLPQAGLKPTWGKVLATFRLWWGRTVHARVLQC